MPLDDYIKIHDDEEVVAFYLDAGAKYTIVAFNNFATLFDGITIWGERFVRAANGPNIISVMAKKKNWFPKKSIQCIAAAMPKGRFSETFVVCIGNSMGGYAAIKYQADFFADVVLSFNPQSTIDPTKTPGDSRFTIYFNESLADMDITADDIVTRSYVIFDPAFIPDWSHAERLSEHGGIRLLKLHNTGHTSIRAISNAATFREVVNILLARTEGEYSELQRVLKNSARNTVDFYKHLISAIDKKPTQWRLRTVSKSIKNRIGMESTSREELLAKCNDLQGKLTNSN